MLNIAKSNLNFRRCNAIWYLYAVEGMSSQAVTTKGNMEFVGFEKLIIFDYHMKAVETQRVGAVMEMASWHWSERLQSC